jgi:hypothetical protein
MHVHCQKMGDLMTFFLYLFFIDPLNFKKYCQICGVEIDFQYKLRIFNDNFKK